MWKVELLWSTDSVPLYTNAFDSVKRWNTSGTKDSITEDVKAEMERGCEHVHVCFMCKQNVYVHTVCTRARDSDMFACVRVQSIFGSWSWGGEREGTGGWQAEGQTWCSAEWVSAAGLLLLLRPGYYSGTLTGVVSPTWFSCFAFMYQTE